MPSMFEHYINLLTVQLNEKIFNQITHCYIIIVNTYLTNTSNICKNLLKNCYIHSNSCKNEIDMPIEH